MGDSSWTTVQRPANPCPGDTEPGTSLELAEMRRHDLPRYAGQGGRFRA